MAWKASVRAVLVTLGVVLLAGASPNRLSQAIEMQLQLADANPQDVRILNDLANLQALAGQRDAAETTYQRALAIDPDRANTLYNLALLYLETGESSKAMDELHRVLEIEPNHAWAHYQLGTIYAAKWDRKKALEHYVRALELDPSLASPAVNPHIVENRMTTEALLRAYLSARSSATAPRVYEDPQSVTNLLLPSLEELRLAAARSAIEAQEREQSRRYRAQFAAEGAVGSAESEAPRDDSPAPEAQEIPEARYPTSGTPRGGTSSTMGGFMATPAEPVQPPSRDVSGTPTTGRPRTPSPLVRPAITSTGRLDLRLLSPAESERSMIGS